MKNYIFDHTISLSLIRWASKKNINGLYLFRELRAIRSETLKNLRPEFRPLLRVGRRKKITRKDLTRPSTAPRLKVIPLITGKEADKSSPGADRRPHNCGPYGFTGGTSRFRSWDPRRYPSQSVSQSAGLYRERNIPEHPRTVEAIIWSKRSSGARNGVIHQNARQMRDHER